MHRLWFFIPLLKLERFDKNIRNQFTSSSLTKLVVSYLSDIYNSGMAPFIGHF